MTLDDWAALAERHQPWVRRAALLVALASVVGFVVRGADSPADPSFPPRRPLAGFEQVVLRVRSPEGRVRDWCALLAASDAARRQGLMAQRDLRGYDAMVFRFDQDTAARFYMFDTLIPLSIAWFDAAGTFVSSADLPPCPAGTPAEGCPQYAAARPYRYAVEVNRGRLASLGVGPGAVVSGPGGTCRA